MQTLFQSNKKSKTVLLNRKKNLYTLNSSNCFLKASLSLSDKHF